MAASSQTMARRQDITLADPLDRRSFDRDAIAMEDSFGGGDGSDWQAFDLEDNFGSFGLDASAVSDIEIAREADASMLPLDEDSGLLNVRDKSLDRSSVLVEEEPQGFGLNDASFEMPFDDKMEIGNPLDDSVNISGRTIDLSTDIPGSIDGSTRASLDAALVDVQVETNRPKKRRKLARDSVTELTSAYLKQGMEDTSDIIRTRGITYRKPAENKSDFDLQTGADMFARPCMVNVSDKLLGMFKYTMKKRKFPFGLKQESNQADDIELTRRMSSTSRMSSNSAGLDVTMGSCDGSMLRDLEEENRFEFADMGPAEPDRLDEGFPDYDIGAPFEPQDQDLEDLNVDIELGAVNDIRSDAQDGTVLDLTDASAAQHKWHPHTVKVMKVLRKSLHNNEEVTYKQLTKKTQDRRTAAALFFEILQLKTLDYVDVEQAAPYADIKISKAARFSEYIPAVDCSSS